MPGWPMQRSGALRDGGLRGVDETFMKENVGIAVRSVIGVGVVDSMAMIFKRARSRWGSQKRHSTCTARPV